LIDKLAAKLGRKVHEVPIGFKYICELMLEQDILIGGEESGGIGTSLYLPERDATVSALFSRTDGLARQGARGVACRSSRGIRRTSLRTRRPGRYAETKRESHGLVSDAMRRRSRMAVVRKETIDGIKLYLGEIGW